MDADAPKGIENADKEGSFGISICVHPRPSAVKKTLIRPYWTRAIVLEADPSLTPGLIPRRLGFVRFAGFVVPFRFIRAALRWNCIRLLKKGQECPCSL